MSMTSKLMPNPIKTALSTALMFNNGKMSCSFINALPAKEEARVEKIAQRTV